MQSERLQPLHVAIDPDQAASTAAGALRRSGFSVDVHLALSAPVRNPLPDASGCAGQRVNELADRLRNAGDSTEVASVLAELSAPGDGVLPAVMQVLTAAATWTGELQDGHWSATLSSRLDSLATEVEDLRQRLSQTRSDLAEQHRTSPLRGRSDPPDPRMAVGPPPGLLQPRAETADGSQEHLADESAEFYAAVGSGRLRFDWHYVTRELGYLLAGVTDLSTGMAMHVADEDGQVTVQETFTSTQRAITAAPRFIDQFEPLCDAPRRYLDRLRSRQQAAVAHGSRGPSSPPAGAATPPRFPARHEPPTRHR
ncbi:hypothetical protein [Peterkaempfera bronchialis]|uniref:hypothetical protein n=1 Tax=Peterkaempfera bronchialis TaxID=2126346 RepID=UPI003C2DC093